MLRAAKISTHVLSSMAARPATRHAVQGMQEKASVALMASCCYRRTSLTPMASLLGMARLDGEVWSSRGIIARHDAAHGWHMSPVNVIT